MNIVSNIKQQKSKEINTKWSLEGRRIPLSKPRPHNLKVIQGGKR